MVEVFKTNVRKRKQANLLVTVLLKEFPFYRINFDLMDRDCILRVEGIHVQPEKVIEVMKERQYECELLN
jgi:hypothetical protein